MFENFEILLFVISSMLILSCCFFILFTKNIMHSCMSLLGILIGVAGLYVTLNADFVAVTQIMVYVGGVVILMLFAVMLTGGKDYVSKAQNLLGLIPTMGDYRSYIVALISVLVACLSTYKLVLNMAPTLRLQEMSETATTIEKIGKLLITDHVLAFEISSVLLLGALVGAAIIARPRKYTDED